MSYRYLFMVTLLILSFCGCKKKEQPQTSSDIWTNVGNSSTLPGTLISLQIDKNGVPYVAYYDTSSEKKYVIKKYVNGAWLTLANTGISYYSNPEIVFALDPNNIPYIAYLIQGSNYAKVMKYSGTGWEIISSQNYGNGTSWSLFQLVFDANGSLYLGCYLQALCCYSGVGEIVVRKYDGVNWTTLGISTDSSGIPINIPVTSIKLALDVNSNPYILYAFSAAMETGYDSVSVLKYNNNNWIQVGNTVEVGNSICSFLLDNNGVPFVMYDDSENSSSTGRLSAIKFVDSNWVSIGNSGFSPILNGPFNFAMDKTGLLYVAFPITPTLNSNIGPLSVMYFQENQWSYLANSNNISPVTSNPLLAFDNNNKLYIAYQYYIEHQNLPAMFKVMTY